MALNCCICGNKIGIMEAMGTLSSQYSNLKLCSKCLDKKRDLNSSDVEKCNNSVRYFKNYVLTDKLNCEVKEIVDTWISETETVIVKQTDQLERTKEQEERIKNILVTNGYNFEGYEIKCYVGLISGEVVLGTGFLSEFSASVSDLFGTQSSSFAEKMIAAKQAAETMMIRNAVLKGGNAVIGINFDYITFSNNMIGVSANGTAVIIEKNNN